MNARRGVHAAITLVLWLITAGLGLLAMFALRQLFHGVFAQFSSDVKLANTLDPFVLLVLALLYLAFVIGTAEYHRKHIGQPRSWRLFAITIVVELLLVIPIII